MKTTPAAKTSSHVDCFRARSTCGPFATCRDGATRDRRTADRFPVVERGNAAAEMEKPGRGSFGLGAHASSRDQRPIAKTQFVSAISRARSGERLDKLLPEAYALVREAARRTVNMRHFDVQLVGGMAMFHGSIAEMETGEGKTLTATLPMYLRALIGKGTHLATVNDYLARRDAEWMGPMYRLLGLTVGCIQTQMNQNQRREAYACDVTYGTAKEFGFDFLRDRLLLRRLGVSSELRDQGHRLETDSDDEKPVHRGMYFALVDEADSILIDEARTPLIISAIPGEAEKTRPWPVTAGRPRWPPASKTTHTTTTITKRRRSN